MSRDPSQTLLDDNARQTLNGLADILIPAGERLPSASQAEVGSAWIERALAARPEWIEPLLELLEQAHGEDPRLFLTRLQQQDPNSFIVLTELVAGAYFMNPAVRQLIGYPGQQAVSIPLEEAAEDLQELLNPVTRRGPIYRT